MANWQVKPGRTAILWIVAAALICNVAAAQEPAPAPDSADSQISCTDNTAAPAPPDPGRSPALSPMTPGRGAPGQTAAVEAEVRRLSPNFALLRGEAERDNAEAQYLIGLAYLLGAQVQSDPAEAAKWMRRSSDQGLAAGQYFLGLMHLEGLGGVAQDDREALSLWRSAANQRFAPAQLQLGLMYMIGRGVTADGAEAARWFRLASDQGLLGARFMMGLLYMVGSGVPQDLNEAGLQFQFAAGRGLAEAQYVVATMYQAGELGVTRDDAKAVEWFRRAADQQFLLAQY